MAAFPNTLRSTVVAFNPNARPAAFPSLDFRHPDFSQISSSSSGSYYSNGILTLKIPRLKYFYNPSLRHRQRPASFVQHEKPTTQRTDTTNFANSSHTVNDQVTWDMIDLSLQVYLYSDLIIQSSSPEAVAHRLGLSPTQILAIQRACQIRRLYPATSPQIWDYCVSANPMTNASYIEPDLLTHFLDYFALSAQYEFASRKQILLAIKFLRHRLVDASILERLLPKPKSTGNLRALSISLNPLHRPSKQVQSAEIHVRRSKTVRSRPPVKGLSLTHLGEIYRRITVLQQRQPLLSMGMLENNMIGLKGQDQGTFALYFSSDYFPARGRMLLSERPFSSLTSLEHWLMYGAYRETVSQPILEQQHSPYASMRFLAILHNRYFGSSDKPRPRSKAQLVYVEILGCIWLHLVKRGWLMANLMTNRISKIPLTDIQRKAYRIVAGNFERPALLRIYKRTKLAFLHSLEKRKDIDQYETKVMDGAMPSTRQHSLDHHHHTQSAQYGAAQATNPPETSLSVSKPGHSSQTLDNRTTGKSNATEFKRSYVSMGARNRSETLSTNATLDLSGQVVRYSRAEPNIGYANVVPENRERRFEGDINLDELFREFLNDNPEIRSATINKTEDIQSSQAHRAPVAAVSPPISAKSLLPQASKTVGSDHKTQKQLSSSISHASNLRLQHSAPERSNNSGNNAGEIAKESSNQLNTKQDASTKVGLPHVSSRSIPLRLKLTIRTEGWPSSEPASPHAGQQHTMARSLTTTASIELKAPETAAARTEDRGSKTKKRPRANDQDHQPEHRGPAIDSDHTKNATTPEEEDGDDEEDHRPRKRVKVAPPSASKAEPVQPEKARCDKGKKRGPYMTKKRRHQMELESMIDQALNRE